MTASPNITIGIIGFGNMGSAIAERIKSAYPLWIFDKDKNKTGRSGELKINVAETIVDLLRKVDTVILAVKPQDFEFVLSKIKNYVQGKLFISIAAGIKTADIEKFLGKARIIRAMPNMGVRIGKSVTCLCKGAFAGDKDLTQAQEVFSYLGTTKIIEERMMNAATAISGSGPAYIFDFIETKAIDPENIPEDLKAQMTILLEQAARSVGFSPEEAQFLAVQTSGTSFSLISQTKLLPSQLKKQIASQGGTTEAALEILHKGGSWVQAAQAALKRAGELSKIS